MGSYSILDYILYFFIYSFIGWVIESLYRSYFEGKLINAGFLFSPFVPIYGLGAILIITINSNISFLSLPLRIFLFTILCNLLEFLTGLLYESVFKVKLWDYSHHKYNLLGKISLGQSILWLLLITFFVTIIKPNVENLTETYIKNQYFNPVIYFLIIILIIDVVISTLKLKKTAKFIEKLRDKTSELTPQFFEDAFKKLKERLFQTFPNLKKSVKSIIEERLKSKQKSNKSEDSNMSMIMKIIRNTPVKKEDMDPEYYEAVKDLLEHPVVQKMDTFKHHDDTTLFHTLTVSQISFYLAKKFNCDAVSVARGGLLHDLFLYDWRDGEHPNHPTKHAERALKNADKHFNLNDIERDIIAKHMWPVTRKFFKYKESFLVSIVDKIVSTKEVWNMGINWVINKFTNSEKEEIQKALDERKKVIQKKEKISDENNNNLDE